MADARPQRDGSSDRGFGGRGQEDRPALRHDSQGGADQPRRLAGGSQDRGLAPQSAKAILKRFDVNKDGMLDESELKALLKETRQHQPPSGPQGPRGPLMGGTPGPQDSDTQEPMGPRFLADNE